MNIHHKGWEWKSVTSGSWDVISEDFLPVALSWCQKYESVLDVGAGKGRHALFFAKNGLKAAAIDLSEDGVNYIKSRAEQEKLDVEASVADMTDLPFENESFDCVICFHAIYHTDYEGVKKALSEIHRVLSPGGEAYITFNAKDNPKFKAELTTDGYTMVPEEGLEQGIPHCYVDVKDVMELLKEFTIVSLNETINFIRKQEKTRGIHFYVHILKNK